MNKLTMEEFRKNVERATVELAPLIAVLSENEEEFNFLCQILAGSYYNQHQYEYQDNLRLARLDRADTVLKYMEVRKGGCCGFYDTVVFRDGVGFLIGFNYGH
jgi:hypothetical protein